MNIEPFDIPDATAFSGLNMLGAFLQSLELKNETGLSVGIVRIEKADGVDGFALYANGRVLCALSYEDCIEDIWALVDALHCYFELVVPAET